MSRVCDLIGKRSITGNKVSFSNKKSKRKFNPNLHTKRFYMPESGEWITLKVSTSALRTVHKLGIEGIIKKVVKKGL